MTACHSLKKLEAYEGKIQQEQQDQQQQIFVIPRTALLAVNKSVIRHQHQQQQNFCHS